VCVEVILAALDEADHAARGTGELRGVLRIALSTSFAVRSVIPRIGRFTDMHPSLRVEFVMNDEKQDLVGDAVDVALRIGSLADSSAVARKIGVVHRVLAASPDYLAKAGTPRTPPDLTDFSIIVGPAGRGDGERDQSEIGTSSSSSCALSSTRLGRRLPVTAGVEGSGGSELTKGWGT